MKYELARRLKEAGFPQRIKLGDRFFLGGEKDVCSVWLENEDMSFHYPNILEVFKLPSLSELIEECWKHPRATHDFNMQGHGDVWSVQSNQMEYYGDGNSPEESVANLWFSLQEHPPT